MTRTATISFSGTGAGLQMGERALTGEQGQDPLGDHDHDRVKEISVAKLPAALAGQIVLTRRKP